MTPPYSWFSITITKTCENAGTTLGAGVGGGAVGAGLLGVGGGAVGAGLLEADAWTVAATLAAGEGAVVASTVRLASWALRSSSSRPGATADGRGVMLALVAEFEARLPSTSAVGMATKRPAPRTIRATRRLGTLMPRLTRSPLAVLRFARSVTQRAGESICPVHTLYLVGEA